MKYAIGSPLEKLTPLGRIAGRIKTYMQTHPST
jgi:hypothetical protein